jgi:hypothetical protein
MTINQSMALRAPGVILSPAIRVGGGRGGATEIRPQPVDGCPSSPPTGEPLSARFLPRAGQRHRRLGFAARGDGATSSLLRAPFVMGAICNDGAAGAVEIPPNALGVFRRATPGTPGGCCSGEVRHPPGLTFTESHLK